MTASLYQRGSLPSPATGSGAPLRIRLTSTSQEVVEVALAVDPAPQAEYVGGHRTGVEGDVVAGSVPEIASAAEEVVRLIRVGGIDPECLERNLHVAGLRVMGVEVHHHDQHV